MIPSLTPALVYRYDRDQRLTNKEVVNTSLAFILLSDKTHISRNLQTGLIHQEQLNALLFHRRNTK